LKKIARSEVPLDEVTTIRSGYGSIKKIEFMEYFTNLRELLLYNNHIKVIEGLNHNLKLNVLSLGTHLDIQPTTKSRSWRIWGI